MPSAILFIKQYNFSIDPLILGQRSFKAVKIGDVNLSCTACGNTAVPDNETRNLAGKTTILLKPVSLSKDESIELPIYADNLEKFSMLTLGLGLDKIEFLSARPNQDLTINFKTQNNTINLFLTNLGLIEIKTNLYCF